MGRIDVAGYLARLGIEAEAPSTGALFRLHAAHLERIPYETLHAQLGEPTSVDPAESIARIVRGRGGYCFHLNGALSALLDALGYRVTRHLGAVNGSGGEPESPERSRNHLALTVTGLPECPDTVWMVDAGLGDGPHVPLPLGTGEHRQGPFRYRLCPSELAAGGWAFQHDPAGSFATMDFAPAAARMADFATNHEYLSTAEESPFRRVCVLARRDADGVDKLLARTLERVPGGKTVLETESDWWAAAGDVFGVYRDAFDRADRELLWRRIVAAHEAHIAAPSADGQAQS